MAMSFSRSVVPKLTKADVFVQFLARPPFYLTRLYAALLVTSFLRGQPEGLSQPCGCIKLAFRPIHNLEVLDETLLENRGII